MSGLEGKWAGQVGSKKYCFMMNITFKINKSVHHASYLCPKNSRYVVVSFGGKWTEEIGIGSLVYLFLISIIDTIVL